MTPEEDKTNAALQEERDTKAQIMAIQTKALNETQLRLNETIGKLQDLQISYDLVVKELNDLKNPPKPPVGWGVASHQLTFRDSVYANDQLMMQLQDQLKNEFIRDQLPMGTDTTPLITAHGKAGRHHHLTMGVYDNPSNPKSSIKTYDWNRAVVRLTSVATDVVEAAGCNEPDVGGRSIQEWLAPVQAHQKALFTTIKNNPSLKHIKVGNGALRWKNPNWVSENRQLVAVCRPYMDFFNAHFYPGEGSDVHAELIQLQKDIREGVGWDGPIIISEGGGTTANMSPEEQARICKDLVQYGEELDIKVYIYELMDDPDATGKVVQANFGIYESNGLAKPAARVLQAL